MAKISSTFNAPETATDATKERKSGRTTFDADGRGVWEWQVSTGVFTRTVTEDQLMALAKTNLELADDGSGRRDSGWIYQTRQPAGEPVGQSRSAAPTRSPPVSPRQGTVRRLLKRLVGAG